MDLLKRRIKEFIFSYGDGNGDGNGYGDGGGYGNGDGNGSGIKSFNGNPVVNIDNIPTIVFSIKNNILKGATLKNNMILSNCYVVKNGKFYAHGKTINKAFTSLEKKILQVLPINELVIKFKNKFSSITEKYRASLFFDWHFILTGSCEYGRNIFIKQKNINLKKDFFTVIEFINIVKDEYGSDIILKLKNSY